MKIISDPAAIRKTYFPQSGNSRRDSGMVIEEDFGKFDYIQAAPVYSGYMLYAEIVNQYHLQKNHRGTLLQPQFLSVRYIVSGSEYVRCGGKLFLAEPGDIMMMPPLCDYAYATGPEGRCFQRSITMKGTLLNTILEYTGFNRDVCFHLDDPEFYIEIHSSLKDLLRRGTSDDCEKNSAMCMFLLQRLSNLCKTGTLPELLTRSQHFIEQNLSGPLSLDIIASALKYSPSTLNKLFRKHLNISVRQYIITRRMDCAVRMLKSKEYSVKEISSMLGFSSISNFSTEFKKHYGKSPRNC